MRSDLDLLAGIMGWARVPHESGMIHYVISTISGYDVVAHTDVLGTHCLFSRGEKSVREYLNREGYSVLFSGTTPDVTVFVYQYGSNISEPYKDLITAAVKALDLRREVITCGGGRP